MRVEHARAVDAWMLCKLSGRNSMGILRVEAVIASIDAVGGTQTDLEKVIGVIEPVWMKLNPVKQSGK